MAKELPYFKFEPNAWENGNIQMLPREEKGLFIDICSMYWSRLGELPKKLVIQKLCGGNATALNSLCEEGIIEIIDDNIFIEFLTVQLNEFENVSSKNSENAKEGWKKRREQKELSERNATASIPQSERNAIRGEEIREDKRKEIPKALPFQFLNSLLDLGAEKQIALDWLKVRKTKKNTNTETAFKGFKSELEKSGKDINAVLTLCVENSWAGLKAEWIENKIKPKAIPGETLEQKARREYVERVRSQGQKMTY